ncbi:HAMP domain-containing sensor histidine kinase [Caulobacter sp. 17J80-11]|uniref:sensor histidine kinase n=1 Tax=Caulobacter sp. 17J80-11 TaxID=2763502 RepID=UPI0016537329|nr:HAMP domain-containing sensor histidine kinase [Caulobacter sp. 17J80-11]MBC6982503.1 HAMP domain-containing histidine kinase [Caulobacter sp. 17J80-11]
MKRLWPPLKIRWPSGLHARLLLLASAFALVTAAMILLPSLAAYHERWLLDRVRSAEIASLAVEAAPNNEVAADLRGQLLQGAGVTAVAVQVEGARRLLSDVPRFNRPPVLVDLRRGRDAWWLVDPWLTLFGDRDRMIRVVAKPQFRSGEFVEVVAPARPLQQALGVYLLRSLLVSAALSLLAGGAVFTALTVFIVRPMKRITGSIERFRADPEDPSAAPEVSGRHDEIGILEEELVRMQEEVRQALRARARLAALGEAVAKINHDLRNMLTSAQMASDRLAASGDPAVAKALPRLERALDRALGLAQNVLNYGKSEEPASAPRALALAPAVEAAAEDAGLAPQGVRLEVEAPSDFRLEADPEQLHRILLNLMRNARQAIEALPEREGRGQVTVAAEVRSGDTVVRIADDGPGLPEKAREHLFQPFAGSATAGGAGLGLAISRELARSHGGDLVLVRTGPDGSVFEIRLPGALRANARGAA